MSSGGGFSGGGGGYSGGFGFPSPFSQFGGGFGAFGPPMGGFGGGFGYQPPQQYGGFGQPFGGGFQQPQYGGGFGFQQPQYGGFQNRGPGNAYARQNPYQPPAPPQSPQQPPPGMEPNPEYSPPPPGMAGIMGGRSSMPYRPIQRANPTTGILPSEPLPDPNAGLVRNPNYFDRFANGAIGTADVQFTDRKYVRPEELQNYAPVSEGLPARDQFSGPVMMPTVEPAVMPSYGSPYGGFGGPYGGSPYGGMYGGLGRFFGGMGMVPFNQGFAVPNQNGPVEATRFNPFNPADVQAQADAQNRQLQFSQVAQNQQPNLRNLQEAALQHEADVRRDWLTNQAPSYVPPPQRTAEEERQIWADYVAKNPWAAEIRQS